MYTVVNHPLIASKVAQIRDSKTSYKEFREAVNEIATFLLYEALRDVKTEAIEVETPLCKAEGVKMSNDFVVVPILRAGIGMMDALLKVLPDAKVGFVGLQRDEETAVAMAYYSKVPVPCENDIAIVIDPMLATGGSACDAVAHLKKIGYKSIVYLNLISAPEGIARFEKEHPDVPIFTASKDKCLNEKFYIVPGLGDAGDRIFGTTTPCV